MKNSLLLTAFLSLVVSGVIAQMPRPVWEFPVAGQCKVAVAPEGNIVAVLIGNNIVVLDAGTGKKMHTFYLPFEGREVALSAGGAYIACVSGDDMLFGKIPESGKIIEWSDFGKIPGAKTYTDLGNPVVLDNGKVLVISYARTVLRVSKDKIDILLDNNGNEFRCEGISPDARLAFCSTMDSKQDQFVVQLPPDKAVIKTANAELTRLPKVGDFKKFTPGGRYLILSSKEGRFNLLDPSTGQIAYSKNSCRKIEYGAVVYNNSDNIRAADYSPATNRLMIMEGPVEEIQYPYSERQWRTGELILLDLANPEPRQIVLADSMSSLEQTWFVKNGELVVGSASGNGKWMMKAWEYNTLYAKASAEPLSPPKITLTNPAPELSTPGTSIEVEACVQLQPGLTNVKVGLLVNGVSIHGKTLLKKDNNCNIQLDQQVPLTPGITNTVLVSAADNLGISTYRQLVKSTAPRVLPPKDERVAYARMNLALIHDDDAYNAGMYKRFLEKEGATVALINFDDVANSGLDNYDLLLTWREFVAPKDNPPGKMPYQRSQPHLKDQYDAVVRKIENSGKPLIIVGDIRAHWLVPQEYEPAVNNWLELKPDAGLKTKFQASADGKVVMCEKPAYYFCLTSKTANNDANYHPLATALDAKYKKALEISPVARFKGRYGLFGLSAPLSIWTPEAKDLLMAFLSSFCEHCPRNSPDPERDLVVVSAGNTKTPSASQQTAQTEGLSQQDFGAYHALLIAVEDYADPDVNKLDNPVKDATQLQKTLTTHYSFDAKNVTLLKNPTKKEVFAALARLRAIVQADDNLLIFYAGHGYWDADMDKGYWLPTDAERELPANWIANEDVTGYIRAIKSKHTLLITDACFSGGIFKTRDAFTDPRAVEEVYKLTSRKAITSGTLTVVPDRSVFLQYLVKKLEENTEKYLSEEQLFSQFKTAVINNSPGQVPQFGTIQNTGDEGGNFIFIRK